MTKEDYMHLPKERLAEMLAERDKQISPNTTPVYVPYYEPYPWWWQRVTCGGNAHTASDINAQPLNI